MVNVIKDFLASPDGLCLCHEPEMREAQIGVLLNLLD